jgi:tetratricopeptide (TPR) repeat protein
MRGTWWAQFLAMTGRPKPARVLLEANLKLSSEHNWHAIAARCQRLLSGIELARSRRRDLEKAIRSAENAVTIFRDGDDLTELADTLPVAADVEIAAGNMEKARDYIAEALGIAGPRELFPAQASALIVRARLHLNTRDLYRGRDDADAALRIATNHNLAWEEFAILDLQAKLDLLEGADHKWALASRAMRTRLIPDGLDPDPTKDS